MRIFLLFLAMAHADSGQLISVKCLDASGASVFNGILRPSTPISETGKMKRVDIPYVLAVSSEPYTVLPRNALDMMTGVTLPQCQGPYAKVFEKKTKANSLHCEFAEVQPIASTTNADLDVLRGFNLEPVELACSVVLSTITLKRVPRGR